MRLSDIGIGPLAAYDRPRKRGDFDIKISKDKTALLIPADLYNFIILECNAQNAQTAMDYLHSRPQAVARLLGWTEEDAKAAFQKLLAHVHGVLNMPQPATRGKKR